jgi:hypothetical protein
MCNQRITILSLMSSAQSRDPDADDDRLLGLIVARTSQTSARVSRSWMPGPDAWVVTVKPNGSDTAPIEAWVRSEDFYLGIAHSYTEVWGTTESSWEFIDGVVEAVVAGHIQEAGRGDFRRMRADTRRGTRTFGSVGLPLPWRWRRVRRFSPYHGTT